MSSDNFRREVAKLKKRVGEKGSAQFHCDRCGQPLRGPRHAELIAERAIEESKAAREELITYVEAIAERQRAAQERITEQLADGSRSGRAYESRAAHERATAEMEVSREQVQEVRGADVRDHTDERPDEGFELPLRTRADELIEANRADPVLDIIRRRRDERKQARELARRAVKPTVVDNNEGDSSDD
ncbi:MAG TPA: hypothetical protein VIW80_01700 [Pyrinomonadaceae bacterium]|jgi:hypothetical protein